MQIHSSSPGRQRMLRIVPLLLGALAAVLVLGRVMLQAAGILFGGCTIAFLLSPLCSLLERKLPRQAAAILALAGSLLLLGSFVLLLAPAMLRQFSTLTELIPAAIGRLSALMENLGSRLQARLPGLQLPRPDFGSMTGGMGSAAKGAVSAVSGAADCIYRFFLMAALAYFLLTDRERILLRLELAVPQSRRRVAVRAGKALLRDLRLYLRGQATIALAVGSLAAGAMLVIGLEGALLLGLIVGIFNVIPYFGPLLGGIPAVLTALSSGWQRAALTIAALFLVQQLDGMLISPRVMGSITGFSPAVVLLAIFIGAQSGGIGGMLIALPALLGFRTLYRVFVQQHENN